jgi:hypothetical protein
MVYRLIIFISTYKNILHLTYKTTFCNLQSYSQILFVATYSQVIFSLLTYCSSYKQRYYTFKLLSLLSYCSSCKQRYYNIVYQLIIFISNYKNILHVTYKPVFARLLICFHLLDHSVMIYYDIIFSVPSVYQMIVKWWISLHTIWLINQFQVMKYLL